MVIINFSFEFCFERVIIRHKPWKFPTISWKIDCLCSVHATDFCMARWGSCLAENMFALPITTTANMLMCTTRCDKANQCPTTAMVCSFLEHSKRVKVATRLSNGIEKTNSRGCLSNKQACCSIVQSPHNPLRVHGVKQIKHKFLTRKTTWI